MARGQVILVNFGHYYNKISLLDVNENLWSDVELSLFKDHMVIFLIYVIYINFLVHCKQGLFLCCKWLGTLGSKGVNIVYFTLD